MKKIESLKLITALSVGLSFLAITILSHWSLKIKLRRDGNYTGKKTSHLLAFKNSERILISISVKFSDINCHRISINTFCASFPSAEIWNYSSFVVLFPLIIEPYPQTKLHVVNCPWHICSCLRAHPLFQYFQAFKVKKP